MKSTRHLPVVENCWSRIGVAGDRSCERLKDVIHCQNCEVFSSIARGLLDRSASEDYLREVTGFVAEPAEARRVANQSVLMFSLRGERYAVWARDVSEVAEVAPPRRIPHRSNDVFMGLVNLQGRLELCVSLAGLLDLGARRSSSVKIRVLVVAHAGQRWVFAIDAVQGMQRVEPSALIAAPTSSSRREHVFLSGILQHQGESFGVLDVVRLCQVAAEQMT